MNDDDPRTQIFREQDKAMEDMFWKLVVEHLIENQGEENAE